MRRRAQRDAAEQSARCVTCGETMPPEFWSGTAHTRPAPVHCLGTAVGWRTASLVDPHHGRHRHPACWRCLEPMGCDQCVASHAALCKRCVVWVYPHHLARFGPFVNTAQAVHRRGGQRAPELAEYPARFQAAYQRAHGACEAGCWCHGAGGVNLGALLPGLATPMVDVVRAEDRAAMDARRAALHGQLFLLDKRDRVE